MKLDQYHVDTFTDKVFRGNPASVIPLREWLPDDLLLSIAKENNLAETAFFIPQGDGYDIRWFTPEIEMDLCGHATLAAAHVIYNHLRHGKESIVFGSASGELRVGFDGGRYVMDFPSRMPQKVELPEIIKESLNIQPLEVLLSRDYVLVYQSEEDIKELKPDRNRLGQVNLDPGGIACTALGKEADFVSRFFTPRASIFEDPVTGSAHCSLIPFWSKRLGKQKLLAFQLSERTGTLYCQDKGTRVLISGNAVTFGIGNIFLE